MDDNYIVKISTALDSDAFCQINGREAAERYVSELLEMYSNNDYAKAYGVTLKQSLSGGLARVVYGDGRNVWLQIVKPAAAVVYDFLYLDALTGGHNIDNQCKTDQ